MENRRDDSTVDTSVSNYGISFPLSRSKSVCNLKIGITRLRRPPEDHCLLSKVNSLKGHADKPVSRSYMVGGKYPIHSSPYYDWMEHKW